MVYGKFLSKVAAYLFSINSQQLIDSFIFLLLPRRLELVAPFGKYTFHTVHCVASVKCH